MGPLTLHSTWVADMIWDYKSLGMLSAVSLATALWSFSLEFPDILYTLFLDCSFLVQWLSFAV